MSSRSVVEGERKQVTVLFADVKGSMELAEQLDPEECHTILDRFFAILTDGVHRFEGTVKSAARRGGRRRARDLVRQARQVLPEVSIALFRQGMGTMVPDLYRRMTAALRKAGLE